MAWSINSARDANVFDKIVVSTEDAECARLAERFGAQVINRPAKLARDLTPMWDVVKQAVESLKLNLNDLVCLLQPTCPFRSVELIRECVKAVESDLLIDSAFTVLKVPDRFHPRQVVMRTASFPATRQSLEAAYVRSGSVYVTKVAAILIGNLYGKAWRKVEEPENINLDTEDDWQKAEWRLAGL